MIFQTSKIRNALSDTYENVRKTHGHELVEEALLLLAFGLELLLHVLQNRHDLTEFSRPYGRALPS